jgi:predicted transcriptional regulator
MAKRPAISRGELEVAQAVWELQEATVGAVYEILRQRTAIEYVTVQTYLRRLESKGYLRTRREGRNKIYLPRVGAGQVVREIVEDLLDRMFDGEPLALMQHLIRERGISPAETRRLREMLDEWEAHDG